MIPDFTNKNHRISLRGPFGCRQWILRDGTWSGEQELEWDEAHCGYTQTIRHSRIEPLSILSLKM